MADTKALLNRAKSATAPSQSARAVAPDTPPNAPAIRKGESVLTERPFSFLKMFGAMAGRIERDSAKLEMELVGNFRKALDDTRCLPANAEPGSVQYPGSRPCLPHEVATHKATNELLAASGRTMVQADPDEMEWIGNRVGGEFKKSYEPAYVKTAMSYLTDLVGGALVAPPEMGELIPLMRNQSACDRAGARMVPLPPQGKWVAPRVTSPSTGYWIGENTAISQSNPQTGQAEMQAKKLGVLVLVPNELFKYASVSADAMLREDMAKTLALGFDFAALYGTSGSMPKGLAYYTGSNEVIDYAALTGVNQPAGLGTDGNTVFPQDGYLMASQIEERNFRLESGFKWLMRPRQWGRIASFRSSSGAVTTADQYGVFVQDLTRSLGIGTGTNWDGWDVIRSSQIRNTLSKGGTATGLSEVWGGVWSELLLGVYGSVEFATATQGDTMFAQDQTMIRGILHADSCPRYPGAFIRYGQTIM